jgi:ABC-type antimicrobial peptide transport system permease subunit
MTLRGAAAFATLPVQMASRVMTGLAGIALVVAIVGVYGAIAALISERMREFALRRVLGASTGSIHLLLLRHGMAIAAKGGVPALVACALGLGALDGRFEDLRRHELAAFSAVAGLMILVTAVACYVPARRILSSDLAGLMRRP